MVGDDFDTHGVRWRLAWPNEVKRLEFDGWETVRLDVWPETHGSEYENGGSMSIEGRLDNIEESLKNQKRSLDIVGDQVLGKMNHMTSMCHSGVFSGGVPYSAIIELLLENAGKWVVRTPDGLELQDRPKEEDEG